MTAPAELEAALTAALARIERELAEVAITLRRLETLLQLVASAAAK